jgi:7-cyano-7-deazaguanine reductase
MKTLKRGQKEIKESKLTVVENKYPDREYEIEISLPEFTCLCPISGYPDFAVVHVKYVPDKYIIELKSLKLYVNKYRDQEVFHEEAVNRILDDLVAVSRPRWMEIMGDFNPRGNVKTVIKAEYKKET